MHIAVITRNMGAGGAERVIAQLLAKWSTAEVLCSLICMEPTNPFYSVPDCVNCYDITVQGKLKKYMELRRHISKIRPAVVLAMPEDIGIYTVLALLGTGIPVVVSERNNPWVMPYKRITRLLRRIAYPFSAGLIFQTKQAMSFFPKTQRKKGIVLDNPLELSRLPEPVFGVREKIVVSAGRLDDQKNFSLLIRAFSVFHKQHPAYKLIIYGEGNKRPELEQLAETLLPGGSWSMPGRVDDLPQRIVSCGMFVLSSDYEGVPNVLIEAMACGMPVVSTDCAPGGAAALIEPGVNGLLVPVGDAEALAEGMAYLAENPQQAAQMGLKAVQLRQRLDADKVCAQWLSYLRTIACKE